MTLNEWAEVCLETYKPNHKEGTKYYYTYRNRLKNCVLNVIGQLNIEDIKPIDCQKCINLQKGRSAYQINQTKQMMNFLFEKAIDNDYITKNPARNVAKPNGTKSTRRSLTSAERDKFIELFEKEENLPFAFMYYCGLRPSEARDIRQSDIIEINGCEAIRVRGTKTVNAVRDIPIPRELSRLIQNSLRRSSGASGGYICNISADTMGRRWKKLKASDELLLESDIVPYCLRHTFCTNLLKKDVDVRIAQKLMGHSSIELTSTIYSHVDDELFTIIHDIL